MSITDYLLSAFLLHGLPFLFGALMAAAIGVPFLPTTFMLVAAGSFVEQGELKPWEVFWVATLAAVMGDLTGYALARWGGRPVVLHLGVSSVRLARAEALAGRWGGLGVFFTRWLATAAGPWVNVASGLAHYPLPKFLFWVVLGESLWVEIFVTLGYVFSGRVQAVVEIARDLGFAVVGLAAVALLAWGLWRSRRVPSAIKRPTEGPGKGPG